MSDKTRKRPKKREENPVREWISDNLRYILLIAIIAVAALIIFLLVRAFSGNAPDNAQSSSVSQTREIIETAESSSSEKSTAGEVTPAAEPTNEPVPTETPAPTESPALEEAAPESDIVAVVTQYLNAIGTGDADAAAAVLEAISEEDRAAIAQHLFGQDYRNIQVYTYPGDTDGSRVAFASYEYRYPDYATYLPALTQLYVYPDADGQLKIASEATQQAKEALMNSTLENEEVQALVRDVQQKYDIALAADPSLAAYVAQLAG